MKLAVLSDSHQALDELSGCLDFLRKKGIHHLAHAGDFITFGVDRLFEKYPEINGYVAIGNCDINPDILNEVSKLPNIAIDSVVTFEIGGIRFGISHREGVAQIRLRDQSVDVFIHGHTHQAKIENRPGCLTINPGSLMDGDGFMLVEIPSLKVDRRFTYE